METFYSIAFCLLFFSCSNTKSKTEQVGNEPVIYDSVDIVEVEEEIDRIDTMSAVTGSENTVEKNDPDSGLEDTDELTFMNFIARFKKRADVSSFMNKDYYYSFMQQNYGGPVRLDHLVDAEDIQVFRARYGESEVEADNIWVYDRRGTALSMCYLPSSEIGVEVKKLVIDTLSLDPIRFYIDTHYIEYEVTEDFGAPERGAIKKEVESQYEIIINDEGECEKVTK